MKKTFLSLLVGLSLSSHAFADDLYQVYQQALQNDPATLQSQASKEAAFSDIQRSRAGLLPQISLTLAAGETYGDLDRSTNDATLNVSQSIYDRSLWVGLDRAELIASQADAILASDMQQLILRTVTA
ncbi:MAG: outer membrane protein, partial [Paraglaciecola sp.]